MNSVYIHIPFCNKICSYCDFPKMYYKEGMANIYLDYLEKEIRKNYCNEKIKTLYIGGGTPSSLSIEQLNKLFEMLKIFDLNEDVEFTFECNVEGLSVEKLILLKKYGVNRLSIGVETFNERLFKLLNRFHTKEDVINIIKKAKEIGFDNINIDLIYAIPTEEIEDLKNDIDTICKLDVEHISTYSLIIEEHTILFINEVANIDEDLDYEMYNLIIDTLKKYRYHHYEISNFSKIGLESKHNLVYWNNEEYYGFGLGAHGYLNGIRYENTRSIDKYISGCYKYKSHILSRKEMMENELILGLRKVNGIKIEEFRKKYGIDIKEVFSMNGLIEEGEYIKIPYDKLYISNEILKNFLL